MKKLLSLIIIAFILCTPTSAATIIDETAKVSSRFENAQGQTISSAKGVDKTKCGHIGVIKLDFSYPSQILALTNSKEDKRYIDPDSYTAPLVPEGYRDCILATNPEKGKMVFYYNYNITKIKQSAITKNGVVFRVAFKVLKDGVCKVSYLKETCSAAGWNKGENRVAGFSLTYSSSPLLNVEKQSNSGGFVPCRIKARITNLKRKGKNKVSLTVSGCKCYYKYKIKYAYNKKMKKAKYKTITGRTTVLRKLKSGKRLYIQAKAPGNPYGRRKSIKIY